MTKEQAPPTVAPPVTDGLERDHDPMTTDLPSRDLVTENPISLPDISIPRKDPNSRGSVLRRILKTLSVGDSFSVRYLSDIRLKRLIVAHIRTTARYLRLKVSTRTVETPEGRVLYVRREA